MSLTAFAQTPEENDASRKATADRLVMGEKACANCDLFQVDLSYQELEARNLTGARLRQADLSLSTFDKSKFAGANMSVVNGFGIRAEHADFSDVNFEDAVLVGGSFNGAKFDNANSDEREFLRVGPFDRDGSDPGPAQRSLRRRRDAAAEGPRPPRLQERS